MGIPFYPVGKMQEEVARPREMGNRRDKVYYDKSMGTFVMASQLGNVV